MCDDWNNILANQTVQTLWLKNSDKDEIRKQRHAAVNALIGISPRDELEGMIAGQLVACHSASMECYRRAMIGEQTFEGRRENLSQAGKLSRTYATLLEALNRHRGKAANPTARITKIHPIELLPLVMSPMRIGAKIEPRDQMSVLIEYESA